MKDKQKSIRIIKRIIFGTAIAVVILLVAVFALSLLNTALTDKVGFTDKVEGIYYFEADYSENVNDDIVYLSETRDLWFEVNGFGEYVTSENLNASSESAKFFYNYFKVVIGGDYTAYKELLDNTFFKYYSAPEKFTGQKIYDIKVEFVNSETKDNCVYETYNVKYKIMKNNGTFRADVSSNEVKPIVIVLKKSENSIKISAIFPYRER